MELKNPVFSGLIRALERLPSGSIVAIDGRCGSGKSSLAAAIAHTFSCEVVHMDDFYLPPQCRGEDWMDHPAGNMDLERLREQVLEPLRGGRRGEYRPFVCRTGEFGVARALIPGQFTIVEGSYSHHPVLARDYDLKIFLTCTREAQERRILVREQDQMRFARFQQIWMPLEERYFQTFFIQEGADLVLDTSTLF